MVMGDSGGGRKQKPRSQTGAASEPAKVGPNGKASLRLAAHCTRLNRPQVRVSLTLALALVLALAAGLVVAPVAALVSPSQSGPKLADSCRALQICFYGP